MADPVPDGYLKITEAFQMFLERKYPNCRLLQPVAVKGAEYEAAMEECDRERTTYGHEFMAPIYCNQVRVMCRTPYTGELFRIPADEITKAARLDKDFDFITDLLSFVSPSPLKKYNGRTPLISERHFTEWLQPLARMIVPERTAASHPDTETFDLSPDREAHTVIVEKNANSPTIELAVKAIQSTFQGGKVPSEVKAKERNNKIFEWCKNNGYAKPSSRSINRALQRLRSASS